MCLVNFTPGRFIPDLIAPDTHWIGGRTDTGAGLNVVENINISFLCLESNPNSSAVETASLRYSGSPCRE
jgi:hypothetical protein